MVMRAAWLVAQSDARDPVIHRLIGLHGRVIETSGGAA
jgi:hypothetical protein